MELESRSQTKWKHLQIAIWKSFLGEAPTASDLNIMISVCVEKHAVKARTWWVQGAHTCRLQRDLTLGGCRELATGGWVQGELEPGECRED